MALKWQHIMSNTERCCHSLNMGESSAFMHSDLWQAAKQDYCRRPGGCAEKNKSIVRFFQLGPSLRSRRAWRHPLAVAFSLFSRLNATALATALTAAGQVSLQSGAYSALLLTASPIERRPQTKEETSADKHGSSADSTAPLSPLPPWHHPLFLFIRADKRQADKIASGAGRAAAR